MHKLHRADLEARDTKINEKQQADDFLRVLGGRPIVIDVGANRGQWAKRILTLNPLAKIFSFEPVPKPFSVLQSWANQVDAEVLAHNLAISSAGGGRKNFS